MKPRTLGVVLLVAIALVAVAVTPAFMSMRKPDLIVPGEGVTKMVMLSDYFAALKGTPADTEVFVLEGEEPGGTVLVIGGTHPNEPGAYLSAVMLIENAKVDRGRVIVIPWAMKSGFTHSDPGEGSPQRFTITTPNGDRTFTYGSRSVNPIHSWPDPEVYVHYPSGARLSGEETRNLNRSYPGKPNGSFAERVAYGICELIRAEKVDLSIDLHEAMPEYPNINVIVAHQNALGLAAMAQVRMMMSGIQIALSPSPTLFRGLTHRELGDHTDTLAVLMEAPNITIGRLRAQTNEASILEGKDPFYVWGAKLKRLFVPFTEDGWPLDVRVARHVTGIYQLSAALSMMKPDAAVALTVPSYSDIVANGIGTYLNPAPGE